jgi:hypothetical protein
MVSSIYKKCKNTKFFNNVKFFYFALSNRYTVRRIAYNDPAALRSGGIPPPPFKSARPAAVAPNRKL